MNSYGLASNEMQKTESVMHKNRGFLRPQNILHNPFLFNRKEGGVGLSCNPPTLFLFSPEADSEPE